MNGGYTGKNMFGLTADYPAVIREMVSWFAARARGELHLVGHVISETQPVEDDYRASEALAAEFPGIVLAPRFVSPSEAKILYRGHGFLHGRAHARLHRRLLQRGAGDPDGLQPQVRGAFRHARL